MAEFDCSALIMIESLAKVLTEAQIADPSVFSGGNQPGLTTGRFAARYDAVRSIPATIKAAAGITGIPSATTESIVALEDRLRGVLQTFAALRH